MAIDRNTSLPKEWGITLEMMREGSSRLPFVEPDDIPEDIRRELEPHYRISMEKWGTVPRYFKMLAHSPIVVRAWMLLDSKLRMAYQESDPEFLKLQQIVIIRTAILNHSINCTGHNVDLGRAAGLTWEQIDLLEDEQWSDSDLFSAKEKALIRWTDAVTDQTAYEDEVAFEAMQQHFTPRQIVELTFLCGMWNLSGRLTEAFHLMVEPPEERIGFQAEQEVG